MTRLAVLATHPIQYQAPLWRWLARQPDLDLHAFFASDFSVRGYRDSQFGVNVKWDVPLTEGYAHSFLNTDPSIQGTDGFFTLRTTGLKAALSKFKPDYALFTAYMPYFWWEALWITRSLGVPIILRAETTDAATKRSAMKAVTRNLFLKTYYDNCSAFLAIGRNSEAHYLDHNISREKLGWSPYCVDTGFFAQQVDYWMPKSDQLREGLGFRPSQVVLIFSGKLYSKKNPLLIPAALARLEPEARARFGLLVLGDGELRQEMEDQCKAVIGTSAVFAGFVNQSELGKYYSASDCLLLPSLSETWGLVVNEALQFGKMVVVSDQVGCHPDLVSDGKTGFVFPSDNSDVLAQRLLEVERALGNGRAQVKKTCQAHVAAYSLPTAGQGIIDMIDRLNREVCTNVT